MILKEEYNNKMKSEKIKMWRGNCICHFEKFSKVTDFDRSNSWQLALICKECGLIQNTPQLSLSKNIISADI